MFDNFWGNPHVTEALDQMLARERIERDDLSLPHNLETVAGREKWSADKRNDNPLLFASHPDIRSAGSRWPPAAPVWRFRSTWKPTTSAAAPCWPG